MSQRQASAPKVISALSARTQFGQIMRRASGKKRERFIVDRRGEPKVVIMGIEDYLAHVADEPETMALIREEAKRKGSGGMSMHEIDTEIEAYRKERALKNAKTKARA